MIRKPAPSNATTRGAFQQLAADLAAHRRQKAPKVLLTAEGKLAQLKQSIKGYTKKPR